MTTVAWDGKTLSADRQGTTGTVRSICTKIFRLPDGGLFAGAGELQEIHMVASYLSGNSGDEAPTVENFTGILVSAQGQAFLLEDKLIPSEIMGRKFHAIGSGSDFALAAMYLKCDSRQAVKVASIFDVHTGGGITTYTPGLPAKRKSKPKTKKVAGNESVA